MSFSEKNEQLSKSTKNFLPAIKTDSELWSKMILLALLRIFHCLNRVILSGCHDHTVNCLWSSANAKNFSSFEIAEHKILKPSFGGWGTSDTSSLGNGSGMSTISTDSVSNLKKYC